MYCWNETLKCLLNAENFSVRVAGELQFHSAGGTHCETMIRNFVLFCSVVAVVGYLNLWKNSVRAMHIHRHTHTHTQKLDFNFSDFTDFADTVIVSRDVCLFRCLLQKYFLFEFVFCFLCSSSRFSLFRLCE
jgi:hypothetical protein